MPDPTPMMAQYQGVRARYPGHLVLFRVGDFYETFYEDAETLSRELEVVLTSRSFEGEAPVPLAGVPHHAAESYLARLVRKGYRVVICDQVEDPKKARGLVRREVTRVLTPGTVLEEGLLPSGQSNFLLGLQGSVETEWWAVLVEVSTGETVVQSGEGTALETLVAGLAGFAPVELLLPWGRTGPAPSERFWEDRFPGVRRSELPGPLPAAELPSGWARFALTHPGAAPLLGSVAAYIRTSEPRILPLLRPPRTHQGPERMGLDAKTLRHLEISEPMAYGPGKRRTLLDVLDETVTPQGRRRLTSWVAAPLADPIAIEERLETVSFLLETPGLLPKVRDALKGVGDLARLASRILARRGGPRDLSSLRRSLEGVSGLRALLDPLPADQVPSLLGALRQSLDPLEGLRARLTEALADDLPALAAQGGMLRSEAFPRLRELRDLQEGALGTLTALERREAEATGIRNLRVGFNQVFGYYLEVSRSQVDRVPTDRWRRKQTLAQGERYTTDELSALEARVLEARESLRETELELYEGLLREVDAQAPQVQATGEAVASLDALATFAHLARLRRWVRPKVLDHGRIRILEGRHPVLEATLGPALVPNDLELDRAGGRLLLLTGPNMAGKSTYMRQAGLLVVLAQAGSFVPARYAEVGVVSSLCTRMGFTDDQGRGKSSFMVEMSEVSEILQRSDDRSLVLLDEVGRGTGTVDGFALAWAILRYLHDTVRCRTIVATHYYGLAAKVEGLPGGRNAHLAVKEERGGIVFLRTLLPGATDKSYGLHVAELAGLPPAVLQEARKVLRGPEGTGDRREGPPSLRRPVQSVLWTDPDQELGREVLEELRTLSPESLTPLEALTRLSRWRQRLDGSRPTTGETPSPRPVADDGGRGP
jgi:DNA mismatch repair protein MutS